MKIEICYLYKVVSYLRKPAVLGFDKMTCRYLKVTDVIYHSLMAIFLFFRVVMYAMTSKEMESPDDIFEDLRKPEKMKRTNYVLQTLWRDLTSDFDVIGPYFTSENGMDSKFIIAFLFTTIHSFHIYGFETSAVVLDGASTNLKAVKVLTGFGAGAFGFIDDPTVDDPHYVKSHMLNPFTNRKMFFIPCPTHQVKIFREHHCTFSYHTY